MLFRALRRACLVVVIAGAPLACGFPEYGFNPSTTTGTGATSSGGGGTTTTSGSTTSPTTGGGGSSTTTPTGGSSTTSSSTVECMIDDDCAENKDGPVCDTSVFECVPCLPANDVCDKGLYCTDAKVCAPGCNDDEDCNFGDNGGTPVTCDVPTHTCIGCTLDSACPPGTICDVANALCVPGCTPDHACPTGQDCCVGTCADLLDDDLNCGACGVPCAPPNGTGDCEGGLCGLAGCNDGFNDCDANPANGCESDAAIDAANCGGCNMPCDALPNALPACSGGVCALGPCTGAFANCNNMASDGCEVDTLSDEMHCSACNAFCSLPKAVPLCAGGTCTVASCDFGFEDCDGADANGCEISTQTDVNNCGVCGNGCSLPNASAKCMGGVCKVDTCALPFADCNAQAMDGCEVNLNTSAMNCGMCGQQCMLPNANAACSNGGCVITSCIGTFADCDGLPANGCETNKATSAANCGACGAACSNNNGTPSCMNSQCSISCNADFENCNMNVADGCEVNLQSNVNNCNTCGNVCMPMGGTPACVGGVCGVSQCQSGLANCDGVGGCETSINTDVNNCGGCGITCFVQNGTAGCAGGQCFVQSCNSGFDNCDGVYGNGCEINLKTLANCGSCGTQCDLNNANESCASGTCQIVSCTGTFANCNMMANDGCEVNTANNIANCGSCGAMCSNNHGSPSCSGGACSIVCAAGFDNCDAAIGNGCETAITNNVQACGGCGVVCSVPNGTPGCNVNQCVVQSCTMPFQNCNGAYADGCEANLQSSTTNCGACNVQCTNLNGTTSCQAGVCAPICNGGFGNCDGSLNNGCETNTNTSLSHCGGCNSPCMLANATPTCSSGTCQISSCNNGFGNCDLITATGCEAPLNTTTNCGTCGVSCTNQNGGTQCTAGACVPTCSSGFLSCDSNPNNGCETDIHTLANCGGCNIQCDLANAAESCSTGTCTLGMCNMGFGNCDGMPGNGCETNTNTNNQHCGGCNMPCGAGQFCSNGACVDSCPVGQADCDMLPGNGCEVFINVDANHCGNCNTVCTDSQYCGTGVCQACAATSRDCDKNGANGCEVGIETDPLNCGGCGTTCGSDGTCGCSASACSGGTIYFSEDFSDNAKMWTLDSEWQIGNATASSGQQQGGPDPSMDHTPSADNGVAGIVIGGNYSVNPLHNFYYLTSPIINTAAAPTLKLSYWRWLNCDFDPYIVDTVEVFNGVSWVIVWTNSTMGQNFVLDIAWQHFNIDVTAHKNANFRVRFGHDNGKQGNFLAWVMSGWNIDDVTLSSGTCN